MARLDVSEPKGISFISSGRGAYLLALHDTDTFELTRGIHANTDGSIKVMMEDGSTPTLVVVAGVLYPYRIKMLYSTGTTAGSVIYGVY